MYVRISPGRSSKLTHMGVEINTSAFQTGCQLSSAASGMSLECVFDTNSVAWSERAGQLAACLSLEAVSLKSLIHCGTSRANAHGQVDRLPQLAASMSCHKYFIETNTCVHGQQGPIHG